MNGRADLRAAAEQLRAQYGHLLTAPVIGSAHDHVADQLERARRRVTGRDRDRDPQLALDLTPPREET